MYKLGGDLVLSMLCDLLLSDSCGHLTDEADYHHP